MNSPSKKRVVDKPDKIDPAVNLLRLIAMVAMTIDHIGYFLFPTDMSFRLIGRIAAPIFAYLIVMGMKNTKSLSRYILRLLVLAVVSQIVFLSTTGYDSLNVVFNFLGVIFLLKGPVWLRSVLIPIYLLLDIEAGWFILALGAVYYYCRHAWLQSFLVLAAAVSYCLPNIVSGPTSTFYIIQLASGAAGFVILVVNGLSDWLKKSKFLMQFWPRYLFYAYYPLNWVVLYAIKSLIG